MSTPNPDPNGTLRERLAFVARTCAPSPSRMLVEVVQILDAALAKIEELEAERDRRE